jgi:hypothetical protein
MPFASSVVIGVTEASDVNVQSVDMEKKMSEVLRKDKDGKFLRFNTFDPIITGSITLLGTSTDAVGAALATTLTSVSSGINLVTEKTVKTTQDNYNETTVSFINAPGAS